MRLILCSIKVLSWSSLPKKEQQQQKQNKWAPSFYFYLKVLNSVCHSFQSSYSHKIWIKFSASNRKSPLITPEHHWSLPFKRLLCLYHADGYTFGTTCLSFKNFCTFFSQLSIIFLFSTFFFFFFLSSCFWYIFSSEGKVSPCNVQDLGLIPASGRSTGGGNGNPLQYSCLENPMDEGAW